MTTKSRATIGAMLATTAFATMAGVHEVSKCTRPSYCAPAIVAKAVVASIAPIVALDFVAMALPHRGETNTAISGLHAVLLETGRKRRRTMRV